MSVDTQYRVTPLLAPPSAGASSCSGSCREPPSPSASPCSGSCHEEAPNASPCSESSQDSPSASPCSGSSPEPPSASPAPLRMEWVRGEPLRRLLRDFTGERTGYVRLTEKGYFMPSKFAAEAEHFINFKPRPDDTWVVTYPRSGTTWTQEMVWLLANDLDYAAARRTPLPDRFPFFEFSVFFHDDTLQEFLATNEGHPDRKRAILEISAPGYQVLERMPGPRFIKTHLPFSLLPRDLLTCGAKVIYVARNPKDVAVSFYHLNRLILTQGYTGDFVTYWDYFQNDLHAWTPYWSHLEEGWERRTHPRLLFMFYEEMNQDPKAAIRKVASFLGKQPNDSDVEALAQHLDISNFRHNSAVNNKDLYDLGIMRREEGFIRKGQTGGWAEYFTPELQTKADKWIEDNLAKTDMRFPEISRRSR